MAVHVKCSIRVIGMLIMLVWTVSTGRQKSGLIPGKAVDFQLRRNWKPGLKDTSDDEDIIIDGSGDDFLDYHPSISYTQHSSKETQLSCCEIGSIFGDCGILCDAELHFSKLVVGIPSFRSEYERKLNVFLQQHDRVISMLLFKQCIERRPNEFYKCCSVAKVERRENQRWNKLKPAQISNRKHLSWRFING